VHPRVLRRAAGGQDLNPSLRKAWKAIAALDGVELGVNVWGEHEDDPAYWVNGKQMANPVGDDELAVRLTRKVISQHRARLKADERVEIRGSSDWIGVHVRTPADVALAVELAGLAAEQYRAGPGVPSKPPPTGTDLDRRRRFH
jgi:hypothetical protein